MPRARSAAIRPTFPEPLDQVREPGTVGLDDEEDGPAVPRTDLGRRGDGDQRAPGPHQRGRALLDLAADHVEDQIDLLDAPQSIGLQIHEGIHAQPDGPAGQPEHPLAHRETGGAVPEFGNDARQLVSRHARRPVAPGAIRPRSRPGEFPPG